MDTCLRRGGRNPTAAGERYKEVSESTRQRNSQNSKRKGKKLGKSTLWREGNQLGGGGGKGESGLIFEGEAVHFLGGTGSSKVGGLKKNGFLSSLELIKRGGVPRKK